MIDILAGRKRPRRRAPSIVGRKPVSLMRLVEVDDVGEILEYVPEDVLSVEMKFNGWLTQWVEHKLYTRRGKELTRKFPHIVETLRKYPKTHLVGELVYWDEKGVMNEPVVTHIAGTKNPDEAVEKLENLPGRFELMVFDILYSGRRNLTRFPTFKRREILEETLEPTDAVALTGIFPFSEWEPTYGAATAVGGDGIVFKNLDAPYAWRPLGQREARPVGYWWKLKPVKVDDFVVYDVSQGPKGSLLALLAQYWEGELIPVGKVNNFSSEIEEEILERLSNGPFVMEVAYMSRFPKPPGRLQHPRFERIRLDKDPEQVELPQRYAPG